MNSTQPNQTTTDSIDKRPWLMDALLYIGHAMAAITHIQEKLQYLRADLENGSDDPSAIQLIVDEMANLNELHKEVYAGYNEVMTEIMTAVPNAKKEYRCLLKHTSTNLVLAMELNDAVDSPAMGEAMNHAFNSFAGAVSLALSIEFKACVRCIYEGIKRASDESIM